jgi:hypothetical protein
LFYVGVINNSKAPESSEPGSNYTKDMRRNGSAENGGIDNGH